MRIGRWDVQILSGGTFRLDGGGVFGTVPKVVWDRLMPADGENRILLETNCLLLRAEIEGHRHAVLVDVGNGDKEDETFRSRFALESYGTLDASLAAYGLQPGDITMLILTHLHFDHAGGATRLDASGAAVPSFPNARVKVQRQDLEDARAPHLRVRASYLPWNWEPLVDAGLLDALEGDAELLPGLSVRVVPGHIKGLQMIVVEGEGRKLVYPTDLIATSHHVQPAWAMGYDLDVVTCVNERIKLLDEVTGTDAVMVFEHDPVLKAGTLQRNAKGKYVVSPVDF